MSPNCGHEALESDAPRQEPQASRVPAITINDIGENPAIIAQSEKSDPFRLTQNRAHSAYTLTLPERHRDALLPVSKLRISAAWCQRAFFNSGISDSFVFQTVNALRPQSNSVSHRLLGGYNIFLFARFVLREIISCEIRPDSDFAHSTECSADCIYIQLTGCRIFSKHVARLRKHARQPVLALPAAAWVRVVRVYSRSESSGIAVSPASVLLSQSDATFRAFGSKRHQLCGCFVGVDICARDEHWSV